MKKKTIILIILIIAIPFYGFFFYRDFLSRCDFYNRSIIGKVVDLRYTDKNLAVIKININDQWIHLSTNIEYEIKINKGDSIFKKSRDYRTFIIKNGKKYNISAEWGMTNFFKYCKCKADYESVKKIR